MTALDYALDALSYCSSDAETGEVTIAAASDAKKRRLASDLTKALKFVYNQAPHLFKEPQTSSIYAPQTGTVSVTNGSTTVTSPTGFTMPINGNTILIGGSEIFNEIYQTSAGVYRLVYPWTGTTGSQSATMWCDVVALATAFKVNGPVLLDDYLMLTPLSNREEFLKANAWVWDDYGSYMQLQPRRRDSGQPAYYWVEERVLPSMLTRARYLRMSPMPSTAFSFRCEGTQQPPEITMSAFGTDTNADATRTFAMPGDHEETILKPIFLYYWSLSPFFSNPEKAQQLRADYMDAKDMLDAWVCQQNQNITYSRR